MAKKGKIEPEAVESQERRPDEARPETVYTNGLNVGLSNADVSIVLKLDGKPTHVLHLSYTLAKTLEQILHETVSRFELAVQRDMLTTKEVDKAFRELLGKESKAAEDRERGDQ